MSEDHVNDHHSRFCANRNAGTAAIFAGFCAVMVLACWRAVSGRPHLPDSGAFLLSYQVIGLLVSGVLFAEFKCPRERTVIGLSFLTPAIALSFAAAPKLATLRPVADRIELVVWGTALAISLSMLGSALRKTRTASSQSI